MGARRRGDAPVVSPWSRRMVVLGLLGALTLQDCAAREPPGEASAGTPDVPRADAALERAVHELVNRHRRARGLTPLTLDQRISRQARLHSQAMAEGRTRFGHGGVPARIDALGRGMSRPRAPADPPPPPRHPAPPGRA